MDASIALPALLKALHFAADKHRDQRRKGAEASPYVNHLIEVAELLAREGGVNDLMTLQAAILHDTLEDTETTPAELDAHFGAVVRSIVEEVTDDQTLTKAERRRLQIVHARHLSERAKPTFTELPPSSPVITTTSKKSPFDGAFVHCRRSHAVADRRPHVSAGLPLKLPLDLS